MSHIILPRRRKLFQAAASYRSYASWPEDSEATLDTKNIHCMMLENPAAGHETGTGLVVAPNLTWTMYNAVPGAVGAPPSRQVTNPDEGFMVTDTLLDVLTGAEFTILIKLQNLLNHHGANNDYLLYLQDSGVKNWNIIRDSVNESLDFTMNGVVKALGIPLQNTMLYAAIWRQAGYQTKCGWCVAGSGANGQPTKLTDFGANTAQQGVAVSPAAGAWVKNAFFFIDTQVQGITAKAFYVLLANISLINNAA